MARFSVEAVFKAVDRVTRPVSRMQNRIGKFSRRSISSLKRLDRGLGKISAGFKRFAVVGVASLAILGAGLANVIGVGAKFEQTLVTAAVKFPGEIRKGTEAFNELQAAASEVGRTTEFTATQSAEAIDFLAMAGFGAKSAIASLAGVVDLATVAQIDLGTATDIATDSMGAFKLISKDAATNQRNLAHVSDILAATSTRANTTIEDMFESLKNGAPVAIAAGQSIETTAALIATMANAGIKGSKSGTALKNIMLALSDSSSKVAGTFDRLKVKTRDSNDNIRDAVDVFADLGAALKDSSTGGRLEAFRAIFGKISLAGAINVANAAAATRDFRDELTNTTGVTQRMAAVMRDTFEGRLNSLKSAIEAVKISIFGMSEGPLADLLDDMIVWTRANEDLIATNVAGFIVNVVENMDELVASLKKITIATGAVFGLIVALKILIGVMTVLNLVITANPFVLIALAIVGFVAALVAAVKWSAQLLTWFGNLSGGMKVLLSFALAIPLAFATVAQFFKGDMQPIRDFITGIQDDIKAAGAAIVSFVKSIGHPIRLLQGAGNIVSGIVGNVGERFGALFGGGGDESEAGATAGAGGSSPQTVSPQERIARSIEERSETNTSEVTIRDETGRAEVTRGTLGGGIKLDPSGAF